MNDLIVMAIQGGRYSEAEKLLGDIILSNPSDEAYFMLGTTKSNLLLDKGRSYLEVQYCFNKYLESSIDKSIAEKNIMIFCIGLYAQLSQLEGNLKKQQQNELLNTAIGVLITFASSKIIDSSSKSFGTISGLVGTSFGIGMSLDAISNLGKISDMIPYVVNLRIEMIQYLKNSIKIETELLKNEILTLEEKYGTIADTDNTIDTSILQNLGDMYLPPNQAIAATINAGSSWQVRGIFKNTPFEIPGDDPVLCGLTSNPGKLMEWLFTKKGIYHCTNSKFIEYKDVVFKKSLLGLININGSMTMTFLKPINNSKEVVDVLNDFIIQMKKF
jgi:hypothetical protein